MDVGPNRNANAGRGIGMTSGSSIGRGKKQGYSNSTYSSQAKMIKIPDHRVYTNEYTGQTSENISLC